jgi:hypothetical protein
MAISCGCLVVQVDRLPSEQTVLTWWGPHGKKELVLPSGVDAADAKAKILEKMA